MILFFVLNKLRDELMFKVNRITLQLSIKIINSYSSKKGRIVFKILLLNHKKTL